MSGTHTPGPWLVEGATLIWSFAGHATVAAVGSPRRDQFVGYSPLTLGDADFNEARANARLIAAAPDLLAALIAVKDFIEGVPNAPEPFGMVRAVITKATGVAA